ncbi:nudix domain-containing [Pyrenophora seminiperda CCB06]|uniref:Nudix domain-containing n=1 Tax=Pyrenophora seminiperda CCB06 TaxID=1302712 RepID=A0A3M7LW48_9PLEO|nr:nudix domain-containing [Pyrenophora seminiperda CCB06]
MSMPATKSELVSVTPVIAQFDGNSFVVGGGVAIFHVATGRVVVCSLVYRGQKVYFLPKGRRDAGEESGIGAEREGYEESGYRNRLLPLPTAHCQPRAHPRIHAAPMTAEPVWMQLMPLGTRQYVIYWYVAETLPPDLEATLETQAGEAYKPPPPYPQGLPLKERIRQEPKGYEPRHHENTGVDATERTYKSKLMNVEDAVSLLRVGDPTMGRVMADVVFKGWEGIQQRFVMEDAATDESPEAV